MHTGLRAIYQHRHHNHLASVSGVRHPSMPAQKDAITEIPPRPTLLEHIIKIGHYRIKVLQHLQLSKCMHYDGADDNDEDDEGDDDDDDTINS